MIDARTIVESMLPTSRGGMFDIRPVTEREVRVAASRVLRLLEDCPDDATVLELREAVMEAFPGVLSGGGV